jgi:hypothetical protein
MFIVNILESVCSELERLFRYDDREELLEWPAMVQNGVAPETLVC